MIIKPECTTVSCIIILIQVSHKYSTGMFSRTPAISLRGNSNQIATPFSATRRPSLTAGSSAVSERLRSLDMFNSSTPVKKLNQEKEINEKAHRKSFSSKNSYREKEIIERAHRNLSSSKNSYREKKIIEKAHRKSSSSKNLNQEKEINEMIHQKLSLSQSQRQKVLNPEQTRPNASRVTKN